MVKHLTPMTRVAKVYGSGDNAQRFISHTFKDKGATITVTRQLDSNNNVLLTRMKKISQTILKNGKKIVTKEMELHKQTKIPGTDSFWLKENFDKFFTIEDRVLSKAKDGKFLGRRKLSFMKEANESMYTNVEKILERPGKLTTKTGFCSTNDMGQKLRKLREYSGSEAYKLQYNKLGYDSKGLPTQKNEFMLDEFEIFGDKKSKLELTIPVEEIQLK